LLLAGDAASDDALELAKLGGDVYGNAMIGCKAKKRKPNP
jgi:hypothetical protein